MLSLETDGLRRHFGDRHAVNGLNLMVPDRSIYGFLGANGAGKTTSLRLILGLLKPDAGRVLLFGKPVRPFTARPGVGALIETPSLYPHLTGRENLDVSRRLVGLPVAEIDRVLEIVELSHAAKQRVATFSLGMKQRLALARALLGSPRLLILDEPTNGLDPEGVRAMRALLRDLPDRSGATLLVSSHLLNEVEQVATHVGLMHSGRLLLQAAMMDLLGQRQGPVLVSTRDQRESEKLLKQVGWRVGHHPAGLLEVSGPPLYLLPPEEVAALLVRKGQQVTHLSAKASSLEDIYHRHVRNAA
jgi:ABC-2 type transport system ATP-binding protein